jgi:hypothetical protein
VLLLLAAVTAILKSNVLWDCINSSFLIYSTILYFLFIQFWKSAYVQLETHTMQNQWMASWWKVLECWIFDWIFSIILDILEFDMSSGQKHSKLCQKMSKSFKNSIKGSLANYVTLKKYFFEPLPPPIIH